MKFLVDAHLPQQLRNWLVSQGYDAIHTIDLPYANATDDSNIVELATIEDRVVITKDSDFLKLYVLKRKPSKLLLITTGNIVNKDLLGLFETNFETIKRLFGIYNVVEMNNSFVLGHSPDR